MISHPRKAEDRAAQLGIWSGLDDPLCPDGHIRTARLDVPGLCFAQPRVGAFPVPVGIESWAVFDLLPHARDESRARRGAYPLGRNPRHDAGFSAGFAHSGANNALLGMTQLRRDIECSVLADESVTTKPSRVIQQAQVSNKQRLGACPALA